MSQTKHTPGKWFAARTTLTAISAYWGAVRRMSQISVVSAPTKPYPTPLAIVLIPPVGVGRERAEELVANLELMASAPDMAARIEELEAALAAAPREAVARFYDSVMRRADEMMRETNRVEGAHYNALKAEFDREFQIIP